jgi:hypothetical protein
VSADLRPIARVIGRFSFQHRQQNRFTAFALAGRELGFGSALSKGAVMGFTSSRVYQESL